jgi:acetyltransferase-like isoleucine patch superfamily enzyme
MNSPNSLNGSLSRDICVKVLFTYNYRYNINIGNKVVIRSNYTILDFCCIDIGTQTIISPNINIFGNMVLTNPRA